jgi:integrase
VHRVVHKALDTAVKWQLISRNVADAVELPSKAVKREMKVLDEKQVEQMLIAALETSYYGPILLATLAGLRRGEIFGLRWSDVDLAASRLTIRQTVQYTPETGVFFKEPKTAKSARSVVVAPAVVDMLRRQRQHQLATRLANGPIFEDNDLVFSQDNGKPIHPDTISSWFPEFLERAGLPRIRFHDLRHTHATLLLKNGIDVKVVSERLGHSGIGITMDTYIHVLPDQQEDAANRLEKLIPKKA